jgi:hypothetical protein
MRGKLPKASWFVLNLCLALVAALFCGSPGRGQESKAQAWRRFEVTADTYIDFYQPYRPHHFETTWLMLRADNKLVPLLRFDVSLIPPGSNVTMARLHLFVPAGQDSDAFRAPCKFAAHCMKRDWNAEEANWHYAADGVRWEIAGANGVTDRCESHQPGETTEVSAQGAWADILVTSIVQGWVDGENHGLVLRGYSEQFGRTAFYSSRFIDTSLHPWLEVQWNAPTPMPTATDTPTATPSPTYTPTSTLSATPSPTATPHRVYLPIAARND